MSVNSRFWWYKRYDFFDRISALDFPQEPLHSTWKNMSKFEKDCWWWQKKDSIILKAVKNHDNTITIPFSSIFRDKKRNGLKKIIRFFNLEIDFKTDPLKKSNGTQTHKIPHYKSWSKRHRKIFDKIAGRHMRK